MPTTIWDAQDALVAILRKSLTGGVPVTLGSPADRENTHVWISGDVDTWEKNYRVSTLEVHDENYTIQVECFVSRSTGDYATVRARMRTLLDEVEKAINSNPTLNGVVSMAVIYQTTMDEGLTDNKERAIGSTVFVRCEANAVT